MANTGTGVGALKGSKSGSSSVDDTALKHSSLGDFTYNPKTGAISKMKGGGDGQANIDLAEEYI